MPENNVHPPGFGCVARLAASIFASKLLLAAAVGSGVGHAKNPCWIVLRRALLSAPHRVQL